MVVCARRRAGLTWQQFREEYEAPGAPVVLTDGAAHWPALSKWTMESLLQTFGDKPVIVGEEPLAQHSFLLARLSSACPARVVVLGRQPRLRPLRGKAAALSAPVQAT